MSRSRPPSQPTKVLAHPNEPSITVTIRKPTRMDGLRKMEQLQKLQRAIPILDDAGKPICDASGEPRAHLQQMYNVDVVLDGLKSLVVGWSGLLDEHQQPIPFSTSAIGTLLEEWLDVEIDGQVISFSRYITDQISKPETWDADPTVSASSKP